MLLVVIGHTGAPLTPIIYIFHVPLFFILSGFLYKGCNWDNLTNRTIKKIKRLYLPFVFTTICFVICNNLFIKINFLCTFESISNVSSEGFIPVPEYSLSDVIKKSVKAVLFAGGGQLGGALWFLRVMFIASIMIDIEYIAFLKLSNRGRQYVFIFANLFLLSVGYILCIKQIQVPYSLDIVCTVMIFYSIGMIVRNRYDGRYDKNYALCSIIVVFSLLLLILLSSSVQVNIAKNYYSNPVLLILTSFVGFLFAYFLSCLLERNLLGGILSYIGRNTISIMCWHFIGFKFISVILVKSLNMSNIYIAKYPVLDSKYWIIYTIAGISFSLILTIIYNSIKCKLCKD